MPFYISPLVSVNVLVVRAARLLRCEAEQISKITSQFGAVLLGTDANARLQLIAPAARIAAAQIIDFFMLPILSFSKASIAFQLLFTWESLPFRSFDFIIMTVFSVCSYEFHPG